MYCYVQYSQNSCFISHYIPGLVDLDHFNFSNIYKTERNSNLNCNSSRYSHIPNIKSIYQRTSKTNPDNLKFEQNIQVQGLLTWYLVCGCIMISYRSSLHFVLVQWFLTELWPWTLKFGQIFSCQHFFSLCLDILTFFFVYED
jgi:hypothetical protein